MVKINFLQFSLDLSNFLQLKPILSAGEDFFNFIRRICQPCLQANPGLKTALSAVPNRDMTDEEMTNSKHGQLLTVKAYHTLKLKWSDLPDGTDFPKCSLQRVAKEEFSDLLLGQSLDHLFEGEVIHMNWVPVKLDIKDKKDIEFVTRKKQIVLMDSALWANIPVHLV